MDIYQITLIIVPLYRNIIRENKSRKLMCMDKVL